MKNYIFIGVLMMSACVNGTLKLTSPAFTDGGSIPAQYTCDGSNVSPALEWSGIPSNTKSLALIVDDPDAPTKVWVHWIIFNISPSTTMLQEGVSTGFVPGSTDFNGANVWGGPCPPSGEHHYHFTLYALDTMLDVPKGIKKDDLMAAMQNHILEKTTLVGLYKRVK